MAISGRGTMYVQIGHMLLEMSQGFTHILILLMLGLTGCMNFLWIPTSSKPKPDYIQEAITQNNWEQAYVLVQSALSSDNLIDRYRAIELLRTHHEIIEAANKSFSITNLESSRRINTEISPKVQWERLSIYRRTIATPEMYASALANYRAVFGADETNKQTQSNQNLYELARANDIADNKLAQELHDALELHKLSLEGLTNELPKQLLPGKTSRSDVLALLGPPSGRFDLNTTLTWALRIEHDQYKILPKFVRNSNGVTHSLVLVFDKNHTLTDQKIIKVIR